MSFPTGMADKGLADVSCPGPRASAPPNSWYTLLHTSLTVGGLGGGEGRGVCQGEARTEDQAEWTTWGGEGSH